MCVVIRLFIGDLPIVTRFDYLCVFVVLDSIMEDYLSAEDHNHGCTVLTRNCEFVILSPT